MFRAMIFVVYSFDICYVALSRKSLTFLVKFCFWYQNGTYSQQRSVTVWHILLKVQKQNFNHENSWFFYRLMLTIILCMFCLSSTLMNGTVPSRPSCLSFIFGLDIFFEIQVKNRGITPILVSFNIKNIKIYL